MRIIARSLACITISAAITAAPVLAEEVVGSQPGQVEDSSSRKEIEAKKMRRIMVTGGGQDIDLVPGSAHYIDKEQLDKTRGGFDDVHRILRQIPGVNVTEEDGFGLRPNIGFRGNSTERSAGITLMEDGVLIAPAPYAAPSAYYFPTTGRMQGIEILKGAGQIKYGPYTTGGSLNFLSTKIPDEFTLHSNLRAGEDNTRIGHVNIGGSSKYAGFVLETYQAVTDGFKDLDNGGDTGFDLEDYVGKFRINSDPDADNYHELEVKLQRSNQISDETYVGLTQADFDATPFRRYSGTQLDRIDVNHDQIQATYFGDFESGFDLTVTGYYNETRRNWFKLENVGGTGVSSILDRPGEFASELAWLQGADSPVDAFGLRNNNRKYESKGVQAVLAKNFMTGEAEHNLEFGVRYHEDEEDRFQDEDGFQMLNGTLIQTTDAAPGSRDNRIGSAEAWAFHVQDIITYGKFTFTPGVRYESIDYLREDFGSMDPGRTGASLATVSSDISALIPGGGVHYQFTEEFGGFFGIHRGFSPPGPQGNNQVDEEESINYEVGVNYNENSFRSEIIFFYNDFDNILGADTASSGGEGTGELFNGGAAEIFGVEASAGYDFMELLDPESALRLPAQLVYTYTSAEFDTSFDSDLFGVVSSGDNIPYIAQNQLYLSLGAEWERYDARFSMNFVDSMPTVAAQSGVVSDNPTDSFVVFDLVAGYRINKDLRIFGLLENVFDEEYVVARRPAGARPGRPQTFLAGIEIDISDFTEVS